MDRLLNFSVPVGHISRILVRLHWSLFIVAIWMLYQFRDNWRLGLLVILGGSAAAPFIYTLF